MKTFTVINVDPGCRPAGARITERGLRSIRMRVLRQSTELAHRKSGRVLRRLFGATSLNIGASLLLLQARLVFGMWLVWLGVSMLSEGVAPLLPVALIAAGVIVAMGFFTRLMMGAGTLAVGFLTVRAAMAGMVDVEGIVVSATMLLFAICGPGRFSCDSVMCCRIFKSVRRRQRHKLLQNRFSYRAYEYARMMM